MIVCVCRRISDREIARHAHAGMGFDEIQFELGVALGNHVAGAAFAAATLHGHATRPVAALRQETAESASGACAV